MFGYAINKEVSMKEETKKTTVHLSAHFHQRLIEIIETRVHKHHPVKTKQGIIEQLIEATHKREVK